MARGRRFLLLLGLLSMVTLHARVFAEDVCFVVDDAYFIIWVVDPLTGSPLAGYSAPHDAMGNTVLPATSGLAFDGAELFYTNSSSGRVYVLDPATGQLKRQFAKPSLTISGLAASDGFLYATEKLGRGGKIYVLDKELGSIREQRNLDGARDALAFSSLSQSLFVKIGSLEVREESAAGSILKGTFVPSELFGGFAFSPAQEVLLAVTDDGLLYHLDPANGDVSQTVELTDTSESRLVRTSGVAAGALVLEAVGGEDPDGDGGGTPVPEVEMDVQDIEITAGTVGAAPIRLSSNVPVEGFVVAAAHDTTVLFLEEITVDGTATSDHRPEYVATEIFRNGGTLGVIFDIEAPFEGNHLPPGADQVIANYMYRCVRSGLEEDVETEVRLLDGVLGSPEKDNLVVVGGRSVAPDLLPGVMTCKAGGDDADKPQFLCGGALDLEGVPASLSARSGDLAQACFYYTFPSSGPFGVQGVSMGLAYDCRLECLPETFGIVPGSVADVIGVDFVDIACDNDPDDGDGCEMVIGLLVDSLPPFDGRTLPPTEDPLILYCVDMRVGSGVEVGECLQIQFRDGVDGPNDVPVSNLMSVNEQTIMPMTSACEVCVTAVGPSFYCGSEFLDENERPETPTGDQGEEVELCLWYSSPGEEVFALTQALRMDCRLECVPGSFRLSPELQLIVDSAAFEFECDLNPDDGDGCEIVLRYDGGPPGGPGSKPLPASSSPLKLGCVTVRIGDDAKPGGCLPLEYRDFIDGSGAPVANVMVLSEGPVSPQTFDCEVCVQPPDVPRFFCGGPVLGANGFPVRPEEVPLGQSTEFCLWYSAPIDEFGNGDEIQGLQMAIAFDCLLTCVDGSFFVPEDSATAEVGAEFVSFDCDNNPDDGDGCSMILGMLVDATPPFDGKTLPPTEFPRKLACLEMQVDSTTPLGACLPIEFKDGVDGTGDVPLNNLVSLDNEAVSPDTFDCEICAKALGPTFFCGAADFSVGGVSDAVPGEPVETCFFYTSPTDDDLFINLQGLSMALEFDCRLTCLQDSFYLPEDSILVAVGADFVDFQCDNDSGDGDGCEMTLAVLVEALPPFDGQALPPSDSPLKLGCVDMVVPVDAECFQCFDIRFRNGVNGPDGIPVKNLISTENQAFFARTVDCEICVNEVNEQNPFIRGDCNASGEPLGDAVNIADAATVISLLFGDILFPPPCLDACDSNDDGLLDLADAHRILSYLFKQGAPPPDPGPITPGVDPTPDEIPCGDPLCPEPVD